MRTYLYSLPETWTFVQGNGGHCGSECRKAEGVAHKARRRFDSDAGFHRGARRDAARHARREARLHIAEHIEALEAPARRYEQDALEYRAERAIDDAWEVARYERTRQLVAETHPHLHGADLLLAVKLVDDDGACHICLGWDC